MHTLINLVDDETCFKTNMQWIANANVVSVAANIELSKDWQRLAILAKFRNVVASSYKTVGRVCLTFADPVRNRRARAAPLRYRSGAVPPSAKPGLFSSQHFSLPLWEWFFY